MLAPPPQLCRKFPTTCCHTHATGIASWPAASQWTDGSSRSILCLCMPVMQAHASQVLRHGMRTACSAPPPPLTNRGVPDLRSPFSPRPLPDPSVGLVLPLADHAFFCDWFALPVCGCRRPWPGLLQCVQACEVTRQATHVTDLLRTNPSPSATGTQHTSVLDQEYTSWHNDDPRSHLDPYRSNAATRFVLQRCSICSCKLCTQHALCCRRNPCCFLSTCKARLPSARREFHGCFRVHSWARTE